MRQDAATIGARAAELLLAAVAEGRHVERRELLRGELIVRESTGAEASPDERACSYRGVEKRFDPQVLALRSLDLDVPDRAFLVLLGPSGCGKTTALRILAGLELPTAGRCTSASATSRACSRATATSPWSSRATRSTRT